MERFAYVTLLLNSDYLPGTLTLAESIRQTETPYPVILLISKSNVSSECYKIIEESNYFSRIINVDLSLLKTKNEYELNTILKRSDLSLTLTKLNIWGLTDYHRVIYLDSDMLVVDNIDELFTILPNLTENDIIASSDSGWPDIFNSGLFVIQPSYTTFKKLLNFYENNISFDGADQGLLNEYFNLKSNKTNGNWYRLPFVYNCTLNSNYEYLPALIRFQNSIKIFHFIGLSKPWKNHNLCYDSTFVRIFNNNNDNLYNLWWNKFNSIKINGSSTLDLLEISSNLQTRITSLSLHNNKKQQKLNDEHNNFNSKIHDDEKAVNKCTEILNPFLSPDSKSNSNLKPEPLKGLQFPTYYYKKPNSSMHITDQSKNGEAWRMTEGKIKWSNSKYLKNNKKSRELNVDGDNTNNGNNGTLSILDSYVTSHPIFPWETSENKTKVSRTFKHSNNYEPPTYSISIINKKRDVDGDDDEDEDEYEDEDDNPNDENNDKLKLLGFNDGLNFERFLNKKETNIEANFERELEEAENLMIEKTESLENESFAITREAARIEKELDEDDRRREQEREEEEDKEEQKKEEDQEKEEKDYGDNDEDDDYKPLSRKEMNIEANFERELEEAENLMIEKTESLENESFAITREAARIEKELDEDDRRREQEREEEEDEADEEEERKEEEGIRRI